MRKAVLTKKDSQELVNGVKEAGATLRGEAQPCRRIDVSSLDLKALREGTKKSQKEIALMIGVSLGTSEARWAGNGTTQSGGSEPSVWRDGSKLLVATEGGLGLRNRSIRTA